MNKLRHAAAHELSQDLLAAIEYVNSFRLSRKEKKEWLEELEADIDLMEHLKSVPVKWETTEDLMELIEAQRNGEDYQDSYVLIAVALRIILGVEEGN